MLMVILKSSIPVITVGLPRFSALCEWKCYLQMERERTCVYFCVVPHPLVPPKRHGPTSNPVVGKSYLNSCVFLSRTVSYYWYSFYVFSWLTLFVTCSWKTWCVVYHICNEKCPSTVTSSLIKTALNNSPVKKKKTTHSQPADRSCWFCQYRFYTNVMHNSGEQILLALIQTR